MTIREFNQSDLNDFLKMNKTFYKLHVTERDYDEKISIQSFMKALNHEGYFGYFILHDNLVIGYALVSVFWSNDCGGDCILLDELYIDSKYRHHGYGMSFLKWIENNFKERAKMISLEVLKTNTEAKTMYASDGLYEDAFTTLWKKIN